MAARPTEYERVNCIVSRDLKREFVRWCNDHDLTITQALRASIRNLLDKREIILCPTNNKTVRRKAKV